MWSKNRVWKLGIFAALLTAVLVTSPAWAESNWPHAVDGMLDPDPANCPACEWDLIDDFHADMRRAWGEGPGDVLTKLYVDYVCNEDGSATVYVLVLIPGGSAAQRICQGTDCGGAEADHYVKIDGPGGKVVDEDGSLGPFAYVYDDAGIAIGWEASFQLAPGTYAMQVHSDVYDGAEQTSGYNKNFDPDLTLECDGGVQEIPLVDIEKSTNGEDADAPPGPTIVAGQPVNWEYVVTNTGDVTLYFLEVTDDKGVTVSCPQDTLDPSESMTCTAQGIASVGQYANIGAVIGFSSTGTQVSDSDPSHYRGTSTSIGPSLGMWAAILSIAFVTVSLFAWRFRTRLHRIE